ncbi:MAG: tRNA (adenosine(37)-N6)-threonylcarbamoyltransferase complex dimerization subunit type 1 TsaB [Deltaproteobacteria bacterium]|nr:tRNA (adenosine(37)-N6)-threonylcarbamoyltransferase complex dimerization subunit type 1 TsaB [Deltaproteobacteria bacterium]
MSAQRPWLVLDTAAPVAVVAVVDDGAVLGEHTLSETKRHAEGLIDAIDRALLLAGVTLDDIEGVGVGRGPGSFIGVRTGIATAKGITLARGRPLIGLSTLLALAATPELPDGAGLALIDAKRGEVYAQLVERRAGVVRAVDPPAALAPADATARAAGLAFVVGSGLDVDATAATVRVARPGPTALGLAQVLRQRQAEGAADETDALVPDYCRPPDAKLPAR